MNETFDSIPISFDETIPSESTEHFIGNLSIEISDLDLEVPTSNLWEGTQFTKRQRADTDFDLQSYPIRTSIKTFLIKNDSLIGNCSGSMISSKHALIAKHCLVDFSNDAFLDFDDITVCPVFNNGNKDACFDCATVKKVFYTDDLFSLQEDVVVVELTRGLGQSTGWIGIGFNQENSFFEDKVFHKFTYPRNSIIIDPDIYNGDTLYHSYGVLDRIFPSSLGIQGTLAVTGESGSSIIQVVPEEEIYTSFGVLSFASSLNHRRITRPIFYAFKEAIGVHSTTPATTNNADFDFSLAPNPSSGIFSVRGITNQEDARIIIYDARGRVVFPLTDLKNCGEINIAHFGTGVYFVSVFQGEEVETKKLLLFIS